ncbi:iron complex outermembrane recepter protein [Sphingomonas laterariae]|uniref:Iron complex outermembrane recepter protein n=1 Tax=Edaphosphingomonas laterariae TaxID=861865 RepID=A0A239KKR7_9SPHN|nr:TonB-dependent receptor [Sphingomonas laterariae]SNT17774.1 iron complex outermembrane recepter protein [Sphingomonas laterariae]
MFLKYTALAAGTALASLIVAPASAQSYAQAQSYGMPSQPLGSALKHLASTADIQILFSNADVDGKQAPALSGRFTPDEALRRLLTGSGLTHQNAGSNVVVVRGGVRPIAAQMNASPSRRMAPAEPVAPPPAVDEPAATGLEDIVVTAQKRAENLQETPLAISAVTEHTIEARSISSVANLGSIAPSLVVSAAAGAPNNAGLFIRGLGSADPLLTADSPVGMYVDGIIIARSAGSAFEIADLERVEVLRGPQGTLYGRNTIGGAVNLITRKPGERFSVRQKFSVGNYDFLQSRTVIDTGELGDSGLRASFTYLHKQRDGIVDNLKTPDDRDPGAYRADGARAAVVFDQGGGFRANYAYDYNRSKAFSNAFQLIAARQDLYAFFAASPAAGGGTFTVSPNRLDQISIDSDGKVIDKVQGHTLTLEIDINDDTTLKSLTGYRKWTQDVADSSFGGNADLLGRRVGQGATLFPVSLYHAAGYRHQRQWSQELNLIGKIGYAIEYVLGAYYFNEKGHEDSPQVVDFITAGGAFRTMPQLNYSAESTTKALFMQSTWHVSDRLGLTGGMRYTWDDKEIDQTQPITRAPAIDFSKFNWAVTADYQFDDGIMGYARIATGYKAGGFSARAFDSGFGPESLTSYEIGLKADLFDRRLRFNTTAYYADHKDLQVNSFQAGVGGASAIITNAGKARYKGIEIEANAVPYEGLSTYATFGYVDRKFKKFEIFNTSPNSLGYPVGQIVDIADIAKFTYSAPTTLNAGAQYEFAAGDVGNIAFRLDYNYRGKVYFHPNPLTAPFADQVAAPARGLLDARITLSELEIGTGTASIAFWGKNITDKKYKAVGIDFGSLGFGGNVYGDPATWGLDLSLKF